MHTLSLLLSPLSSRGQLHRGSTCLDTGQSFLKESVSNSHLGLLTPTLSCPPGHLYLWIPLSEAPGSACKFPHEDICTSKPDLIGGYSSHLCYCFLVFPSMVSHSFIHQASFTECPPTGTGPLVMSLPGSTPYSLHSFNLITQKHSPRGWSWPQPPTWNSC